MNSFHTQRSEKMLQRRRANASGASAAGIGRAPRSLRETRTHIAFTRTSAGKTGNKKQFLFMRTNDKLITADERPRDAHCPHDSSTLSPLDRESVNYERM